MAHSASAKKRIRQNAKNRARNRWRRESYRSAIKRYDETVLHGSVEQAEQELQQIYKLLDRTAAKGVIHPNKAARQKSRLTGRLNAKKTAG